jgi:regulator of protease activity HflC (stomatin/prohibitin superfamily)
MVGNHFRNSAQNYEAIDFLKNRSDRQREAIDHIKSALSSYGVEAVDTLIGEIDLPDELEKILTDRKIAEEKRETYQAEQVAEEEHRKLMYAKYQTEIQQDVVRATENVKIAEMEAEASVKKAEAEAEAFRIKGQADADVTKAKVDIIGSENYTILEIAKEAAKNQLPFVPGAKASIFVDSQGGTRPSVNELSALHLTAAYMDTVLKNQARLSELPEAQLPALPQSYLVCPNCQTKNSLSNNFCTKCGNRLH